jgi:hypothetical protein
VVGRPRVNFPTRQQQPHTAIKDLRRGWLGRRGREQGSRDNLAERPATDSRDNQGAAGGVSCAGATVRAAAMSDRTASLLLIHGCDTDLFYIYLYTL